MPWAPFFALGFSAIIFTLGVAGYFIIPSIIGRAISEQMRLVNGSSMFAKWRDPSDVPGDFSVFLFNITNPEEFAVGGKPIVDEVGPYVFLQKQRKIVTNIDKDTVTYRDNRSYHFVASRSKGSLNDRVYILNIPLITLDQLVRTQLPPTVSEARVRSLLTTLIDAYNETIVIQRSIGEMLFDGYDTPMLVELTKYSREIFAEIEFPLAAASRFGLLYGENGTAQQWYTVGTGVGSYPIGSITEWNNRTSLTFWTEDRCNQINGTDGTIFSAPVDKHRKLFVFVASLCRSVYMRYSMDSDVGEIETGRFTLPDEVYASGESFAENQCFCDAGGRCPKSGLMPVRSCRSAGPIAMSSPHFYQGTEKLVEDIVGVRPLRKLHETFVDVHLKTGLVLRAARRFQINVDLERSDLVRPLANVTSRIVPVAWIDERMDATKLMIDSLIEKFILPEKVGVVVSIAAILGGAIGVVASALVISLNLVGS